MDRAVWNPDWGVDLDRAIVSVPTPQSAVIQEALRLYQTELRKPSLTVWVLDVSGSMGGAPLDQLKAAMDLLLDPDKSALNLLQPSSRDVTIVIPFSDHTGTPVTVKGNDPAALRQALAQVQGLQAGGGTDLYGALGAAIATLKPYSDDGTLFDYLPAIVAMTDGASETGYRQTMLDQLHRMPYGRDVPIHAIAFGQADLDQLKELNRLTIGRLFQSGDGLAQALQAAKGYN